MVVHPERRPKQHDKSRHRTDERPDGGGQNVIVVVLFVRHCRVPSGLVWSSVGVYVGPGFGCQRRRQDKSRLFLSHILRQVDLVERVA